MKIVEDNLIRKLKSYYKIYPTVMAFVLAGFEWESLCNWWDKCIKVKKTHGAKSPKRTSRHHVLYGHELKDWSAVTVNKTLNPEIWLAGTIYPELPDFLYGANIKNVDYLIFIQEARTLSDERLCHLCKVKNICPNMLGYLTHEFVHIVENERKTKILPESPRSYSRYVGRLLRRIFSVELEYVKSIERGLDIRIDV